MDVALQGSHLSCLLTSLVLSLTLLLHVEVLNNNIFVKLFLVIQKQGLFHQYITKGFQIVFD